MIWNRKLGVFELLIGIAIVEVFVGSRLAALFWALGAVVAYYTKKKFAGEFSLADAWSVVSGSAKQAAAKIDGSQQ